MNNNTNISILPYGRGSGKSSSSSSSGITEDANTLRSNAIARLIDIVSAGVIYGLVDSGRSIYIDNTPLLNNSYENNYSGISYTLQLGTYSQSYVAGFTDATNVTSVDTECTYDNPLIRSYSNVDAVKVVASIPSLYSQNTSTGDIHGSTVSYSLYKRKTSDTDWSLASTITLTGKCTSSYERATRIELDYDYSWDIKFVRNTADSTSSALANETYWSYTTEILDGKFSYPGCAYFAWKVDASQYGTSIPSRKYYLKGIIVKIPSNYNPITRTYTGIWNGTFTSAWTNNPAWIIYDLLTDPVYGLAQDESLIDKWSFYQIAQYCDEYVDDGFGTTEPRYTFNYWFDGSSNALDVIQTAATIVHGIVYWASGQIFIVADMPEDAIKLVTPANIKNGEFTYEGISYSAKHSVCAVTWFDPNNFCEQSVELVEDAELIAELGYITTTATLVGCTSQGQANRHGKWVLDSERYGSETVSYEAAYDHLDVVPGQIILIQDPDYAGISYGGRLLSTYSDLGKYYVLLDREVEIESGVSYVIKVVCSDGSIEQKTVVTYNEGSFDILEISEDFTVTPINGAMWIITTSNLSPRAFRVISISESEAPYYAVTALLYDSTKYDRIESDLVLTQPNYAIIYDKPNAPTALNITERLYSQNDSIETAVTISWTNSTDDKAAQIKYYEVEYSEEEGNWISIGQTKLNSIDLYPIYEGTYKFRVRAVGVSYLVSTWLTKTETLFGLDTPPANVRNFYVQVYSANSTLSWDENTELDISYYRIRFSSYISGATWEGASTLVEKCYNNSVSVASMYGTYLIKAVDSRGNESETASIAIPTADSNNLLNELLIVSDWPLWSGTLTNLQLVDNSLKLAFTDENENSFVSSGEYIFSTLVDLGAKYTSTLTTAMDISAEALNNCIEDWTTLNEITYLSGADTSNISVVLYLRYTDDDPTDTEAAWSNWLPFIIGDYSARGFQFKLIATTALSNVTPIINDISINIDMPDRIESGKNITSAIIGTTITFNAVFKNIPTIGITPLDAVSGDTFSGPENATSEGFTIIFYDSTGTAVSRLFNWSAHGYGRITS